MKNDNPLLQKYTLPPFDKIMVRHVEPAINYMIDENRKELKDIIKNTKNYTWKNFFQKIENMEDRLQRVWSPVSHLHSVADNNELRKAYNNCLTKLSNYSTEMGQNIDLFKTYDIFSKKSSYVYPYNSKTENFKSVINSNTSLK